MTRATASSHSHTHPHWPAEPKTGERESVTAYELPVHVLGADGQAYAVRARACLDDRGRWSSWLEFRRARGDIVMRTGIETTQASIGAVSSWARGLGAQFLRGALERARNRYSGTKQPALPVLVREHAVRIFADDGVPYRARTWAREEEGHSIWIGWLEFISDVPGAPTLRTGSETTQPNLSAVEFWADGLEPVYFEGAFARARAATESTA